MIKTQKTDHLVRDQLRSLSTHVSSGDQKGFLISQGEHSTPQQTSAANLDLCCLGLPVTRKQEHPVLIDYFILL